MEMFNWDVFFGHIINMLIIIGGILFIKLMERNIN